MEKTARLRMKKKQKPLLFRIVFRMILFLLLFLLVLFLFYVNGNVKLFQDVTQLMILYLISIISIFLLVFSIFALVLIIVYAISQKTIWYLLYLINIIFSSALALAGLFFSRAVDFLASGL